MSYRPHRGLQLPAHKQRSRDAAIVTVPVSEVLALPLNQHGASSRVARLSPQGEGAGEELQPVVQTGETVRLGQIIAQPTTPLGAYLHAPVSGTVLAIEPRATPQQTQQLVTTIVIVNDGSDTRDSTLQARLDWQTIAPLSLCEHLARGGIVGLGGAVFPTATKLAAHTQHPIEYLFLNGVECEPFITCDDRLMRERAESVLQGAQVLLHAAQAKHCIVAIEADKPEALAAMRAAAQQLADVRIEVRAVATAYPSGDEGQLIAQLLGREIPRGGLPAEIGVIVQNVATAYACAQWIHQGQPLISRIVTVTGPGVSRPANLEVRLGTSMSDLIQLCGGDEATASVDSLIMGGAMMGRSLTNDQLPIVKASNCLIIARHTELESAAVEMPCIRCGECATACPVNLLPQQLLAYARNDNRIALQELGLLDCIECGCCDYVCPSHITLAGRFHAAKSLQTA